MKKDIKKFTDAYIKIINEDTNSNEFKGIEEAKKAILFIDFLRKKHIAIPVSIEKNYEDAINYIKKYENNFNVDEFLKNSSQNEDKKESDEDDEIAEEDVSPKDAFLSKIYDLIDTVYQIGIKAGKTGEEINPHEDEDVNDILGSIEADFDDGKPIQ